MTKNPLARLGTRGDDEIRNHKFFSSMNWKKLEAREIRPSFVPTITSPFSVENFDREFTSGSPTLSPAGSFRISNAQQDEFRDFSYVHDELLGWASFWFTTAHMTQAGLKISSSNL